MSIHLMGGGAAFTDGAPAILPFLREVAGRAATTHSATTHAERPTARVGVVIVHSGAGAGAEQFAEVRDGIAAVSTAEAVPILAVENQPIDLAALADLDGLVVWGGLTPAYRESLAPVFGEIRRQVAAGLPYFGYSAGSALAADTAIVGGWRIGDVPVAPEHAAEGLDQVTLADGLGLLDLAIDVHAAQWGTLARLIAATEAGLVDGGIAIDEDTALIVGEGALRVVGRGSVWKVSGDNGSVRVSTLGAQ